MTQTPKHTSKSFHGTTLGSGILENANPFPAQQPSKS